MHTDHLANPPAFLASRNREVLAAFEVWLLASDRGDGTIALRMRYARDLAHNVDLLTATIDDLELIMARRRTLEPETRKSQLATWRILFGWAHKRGHRPDDPTAEIPSIRIPVKTPRVAPDEAIESALRSATPRDRAMVMLARYAGLRLSELTQLHTRDRDGERLHIIGKGARERIVYANEPLLFGLHALEHDHPGQHYFPGLRSAHMHPMSVNKIITRVTGWNPHSLRHAAATAAYNETHDLEGVRIFLGHASLATTQRYLHHDDATKRVIAAATVIRPRQLAA